MGGWRKDVKWMVGIALVFTLAAACAAYGLYRLSDAGPARGATAAILEALMEQGISEEQYAELQAAAQANPDAEVRIEDTSLPLLGSELAGLNREQAVREAAVRLADIIYDEGPEGIRPYLQPEGGAGEPAPGDEAPAPDGEGGPPGAEAAAEPGDGGISLGPLALFTRSFHQRVRPFMLGLGAASLVLLVLLAALSRGFGRLGSVGFATALGVAPAALAAVAARAALGDAREGRDDALGDAAGVLLATVESLSNRFLAAVAAGAALVVLAVLGKAAYALGRSLYHRRRRTKEGAAAAVAAAQGDDPVRHAA